QLADDAMLFCGPFNDDAVTPELREKHLTPAAFALLRGFAATLDTLEVWNKETIAAAMKATLAQFGVKMPALGIPLRLVVTGRPQTPSIDAVLTLLGKEKVMERLHKI